MTPLPLRGTHKHQVLRRVAAEQSSEATLYGASRGARYDWAVLVAEQEAEANKKQQEKEKQVTE